MSLIWICFRQEVNNIFANSRQQKGLAGPSLLISVVGGRDWAGWNAQKHETANLICILVCQELIFNYQPAKMVGSVCMSFHFWSLPSHETGAYRKGPRTLAAEYTEHTQQARVTGAHMCMRRTRGFCCSYIIMNHTDPSFQFCSIMWTRSLFPCVCH